MLVEKNGSNNDRAMTWCRAVKTCQQIKICENIILSTVVCGIYLTEPDTILVFEIFYGVFGGGTRLAMPKTICAPDSSSLKPGLGLLRESWIRGSSDSRTIYFGWTVGL